MSTTTTETNLIEVIYYLSKWCIVTGFQKIAIYNERARIVRLEKERQEKIRREQSREYWKFVYATFLEWLSKKFSSNKISENTSHRNTTDVIKPCMDTNVSVHSEDIKASIKNSNSVSIDENIKDIGCCNGIISKVKNIVLVEKINTKLTKEQLFEIFENLYSHKYVKKTSEKKILNHFLLEELNENRKQKVAFCKLPCSDKIQWKGNVIDLQFMMKRLFLYGMIFYPKHNNHVSTINHFNIQGEVLNRRSITQLYSSLPNTLEDVPKNQTMIAGVIDNVLKKQN